MTTRKISAVLLFPVIVLLLAGCASVKFFDDQGLKSETGLRVYSPKPYLLVEYQTTKTGSVKTSIVYLPDRTSPQYIKIKPGIGSAALKLELANGILTSYGLTTDTKVPETLGKITDLLTKSTTSIADITRSKAEGEPDPLVYELFEIVIADGQTRLVPVK
jgi:hypothetical protein